MSFQLQGLDEKAQQLSTDVSQARDEIMAITTEIEGMRKQRDEKISKIQSLQASNQQIAINTERFSHVNLQLQTESQKSLSRSREIETLKRTIAERKAQISETITGISEAKQRLQSQQNLISQKRPAFEEGQQKLNKLASIYTDLLQKFIARQQELHQKVMAKRQKQAPQDLYEIPPDTTNTAFGFGDSFTGKTTAPFGQSTTSVQSIQNAFASPTSPTAKSVPHADAQNTSNTPAVKYRALYEFLGRSDDELTLQPGDTILVFENHAGEPGWLAGQLRDKVGWFPAAFAEPMTKKPNTTPKQSSITTSPSSEPLESIKEEPTEKEISTGILKNKIF